MKKNSSRLNELDALRGIAALLVVAFHFTMGRREAAYGFKYGICGVDLFFVISGFVIFMSLTRVKTGADFIISRASRLYPAYWAAVSFTFMLIVGRSLVLDGQIGKIGLLNYLANLTMFQFFVLIPDLDGPYWSLTIELMFYVAVLILFQKKMLKWITPIAIVVITLSVATQLIFWNYALKVFYHAFALLKYLPLFLAGITFYRMQNDRNFGWQRYLLLLFCFVSQVLFFHHCARERVFMSLTDYSIALTLIFIIFILFVHGRLRFLVSRPTLFLGRISYPLYLIHQFLSLNILFPFLMKYLHLPYAVAAFCITLPIDILFAFAICRIVDEPYSKKMKGWLTTRFAAKMNDNTIPPTLGSTVIATNH